MKYSYEIGFPDLGDSTRFDQNIWESLLILSNILDEQ